MRKTVDWKRSRISRFEVDVILEIEIWVVLSGEHDKQYSIPLMY
jgi:hypothetical protein